MKRNKKNPSDSLEMFLDTICNTFGGILFILLFIVLQLQASQRSFNESAKQTVSAVDFDTVQYQHSQRRAELDQLKAQKENLVSISENLSDKDAPALYQQWKEKSSVNRELVRRLEDLTKQIKELENQDDPTEARDRLNEEIAELQRQIALLEKENQEKLEEQQEKATELTLPQLKKSSKNRVSMVVRFGRVYLWYEYDKDGNPIDLNKKDFTILGQRENDIVVYPNAWRGIDLMRDDADKQIGHLVAPFSPEEYDCGIITTTDSFEQYKVLRDALKKRGYDISPIALNEGCSIRNRGGSGDRTAQ